MSTFGDVVKERIKTLVVTGGSGFIGQHLCRRLCDAGHQVHATSRRRSTTRQSGPTWHQADMADLAAARRIFTTVKPDVVFHLAGAVGASPELGLVVPTFQSLAREHNQCAGGRHGGRLPAHHFDRLPDRTPGWPWRGHSTVPLCRREMGRLGLRAHVSQPLRRAGRHIASVHDVWPRPGRFQAHPCGRAGAPSRRTAQALKREKSLRLGLHRGCD